MRVETNPHNYTNMNNSFSQFVPVRISPKEISGANGKFLPKPLLFHLRHPNSKTDEPKFWQILSPKKCFAKTSSALFRHTARILGGQNPERKTPFPFSKEISPPPNQKCKECFSFGVAEALRGSGGTIHSRSKKVRANAIMTPPR